MIVEFGEEITSETELAFLAKYWAGDRVARDHASTDPGTREWFRRFRRDYEIELSDLFGEKND